MKSKPFAKLAPTIMLSLIGAAVFLIYMPVISFLGNVNHFNFSFGALLEGMLVPAACLFAVLLLLLLLLNRQFVRSGNTASSKNNLLISPLHILLLFLLLGFCIEGSLLSIGLPELTGEKDLFSNTTRLVLDSIVWVVLIIGGLVFWRKLAKRFGFLVFALCLLLGLGFGDAYLNQEEKIPIQATSYEVLDQAKFNHENNVLVVVLDAMSTALIKEYLDNDATAYQKLDGFTFFENNLETSDSTQWSLPSILKGDIYQGGSANQYQTGALTDKSSILQVFHAAGYDVYASSTLPMFNTILLQDGEFFGDAAEVSLSLPLYGRLFLRFAPYVLKNSIANRLNFDANDDVSGTESTGNLEGTEDIRYDERAYLGLINAIEEQASPNPSLQVHHVHGAHMPYIVDSAGNDLPATESNSLFGLNEQSRWTMNYVEKLLQAMRDNGLYDSTTIILLGDHGDRMPDSSREYVAYCSYASLLIKPAGSSGPLVVSQAPTSNMYVAKLLESIHLQGESLDELTQDLPGQRLYFSTANSLLVTYSGADVTKLHIDETIAVDQQYEATKLQPDVRYSLVLLGENSNIAVPLSYSQANFTNGWGLRANGETMQVAMSVEGNRGAITGVLLGFEIAQKGGGVLEVEPTTITIKDLVSGKEMELEVEENYPFLYFDGAEIADNLSLQFEISFSPLQEKMQYFLSSIEYKIYE